ncbi:hypothetical protein AB0K18_40530 [Nonomuraea sp. NPDC049421]
MDTRGKDALVAAGALAAITAGTYANLSWSAPRNARSTPRAWR